MSSSLAVWMNGRRVGRWTQRRGSSTFQYDLGWAVAPERRRLSLSLDFQPRNAEHKGAVVTDYFDNLLPDSEAIRKRLQSRFGTESRDAFDLLKAIGRDCVGAVQILPEDEEPGEVQTVIAQPLDDAGVEKTIGAALSGRLVLGQANAEEFRISLAGAQEKIALLRYRNQWCRPLGPTPTTHIFKLPLGLVGNIQADMLDSVENEWLCLKLMAAFGLDTAQAEIREFGSRKVLVVERFDRSWQSDTWIARHSQEDFCQALGRPGHRKYESEGGPGIKDILDVLAFSAESTRNRRDFAKAQLIFWLLAATDGHAKNFSLFHEPGGAYRLTPFYDVLSAWPIIGPGPNQLAWQKTALAMALHGKNTHRELMHIRPRHWHGVARLAGLGDAENMIKEVLIEVPKALASVGASMPNNFPARIRDTIFAGVERQAQVLEAG